MAGAAAQDEIRENKAPENMSVGVESVPSSPGDSDGEIHSDNDQHIRLGWKTWLVVFITCFGYASSLPPLDS